MRGIILTKLTVLLLNAAVVIAGSLIGSNLKKVIRKDVLDGVMIGIGVVTVFIGATGVSTDINVLTLLIAYSVGCFIGYSLDLQGKLDSVSQSIEKRFSTGENKIIGPGISFFIISCSGAFTINACFFAGMGDFSLLYTKISMDFIVSITLSSALGIGVLFSIVPITLFQGALILLSGVLSPLMTPVMIRAFASAGSLVAVLVGTNLIGVTKIKIINFIPCIFLAPFAAMLTEHLA